MPSHAARADLRLRAEPRDEVMHRTHAIDPDGRTIRMIVVNMSASGLMARCETAPAIDARIRVTLPVIGQTTAVVRWSLGGRMGCELDRTIPPADYHAMLSAMLRSI